MLLNGSKELQLNIINTNYIELFKKYFYMLYCMFIKFVICTPKDQKWQIFFFRKRKKKNFKINYEVLLFNKNVITSNNQNDVLHFKRKYGVLKYKYDDKAYNLYKMNYMIDLKRKKKKKVNFQFLNSLRKKNINKLFFKKNRINIFKNFDYKVLTQKKKSKVIYSLFKKNNLVFNKLTLGKLLLTQRFFSTYEDAKNFIHKGGVVVNNQFVSDHNLNLNVGDVIKLPHNELFFFYLTSFNLNRRKYLKMVKPRIFKLIRNKVDINKQATKNFPKWTLKFFFFKETKPTNVEYDYFTFTFVILTNSRFIYDCNFNLDAMFSLYMYRLYNWKYIV